MAGRKRIPTHLHVVRGTVQPCRINRDEPKPPQEPPRPAVELPARAAFWFGILCGRVTAMGVGSSADSEEMMLLAMRLAEVEECDEAIREHGRVTTKLELIEVPDPEHKGRTVTKAQRVLKSNPAVAQRSEAMRHVQALLAEFGLSPANRGKVSAKPRMESGSANPWEALLNS